jgi:hypothetical protein
VCATRRADFRQPREVRVDTRGQPPLLGAAQPSPPPFAAADIADLGAAVSKRWIKRFCGIHAASFHIRRSKAVLKAF